MAWQGHWRAGAIVGLCMIASSSLAAGNGNSGWRLLRAPNADGSPTAAMTHTADMIRSDVDLAGLMLLCGEKSGSQASPTSNAAQVAIVVVTPFAPHANPIVTIRTTDTEWQFEGRSVPPGAELVLPPAATALVDGPWLTSHELTIKISWRERSFGGVIPIDGLAGALATLAANCPSH